MPFLKILRSGHHRTIPTNCLLNDTSLITYILKQTFWSYNKSKILHILDFIIIFCLFQQLQSQIFQNDKKGFISVFANKLFDYVNLPILTNGTCWPAWSSHWSTAWAVRTWWRWGSCLGLQSSLAPPSRPPSADLWPGHHWWPAQCVQLEYKLIKFATK